MIKKFLRLNIFDKIKFVLISVIFIELSLMLVVAYNNTNNTHDNAVKKTERTTTTVRAEVNNTTPTEKLHHSSKEVNVTEVSEVAEVAEVVKAKPSKPKKPETKTKTKLEKVSKCKTVIKNRIMEVNRKISAKTAELYANVIFRESTKRNVSPFVQTALLNSESSFRSNPTHKLPYVVGMGGINWRVWKDMLRKEGICWNKSDLENPVTNIKASVFILSHYNDKSKHIKEALTRYKGVSSLGRRQANLVYKKAMALAEKENS